MKMLYVVMIWLGVLSGVAAGAVLFSDNFNRADGALGGNWVNDNGDQDIANNQVRCAAATACTANGALGRNTLVSRADSVTSLMNRVEHNSAGTVNSPIAACRKSGAGSGGGNARTYYGFYAGTTTGNDVRTYALTRSVTGTAVDLVTAAANYLASSTRLTAACTGTTIEGYVNGLLSLSTTDSQITAGNPGFYNATEAALAPLFDNFAMCDAVAECDSFAQTGSAAAAAAPGGPSGKSLLGVGQ